MTRTVTAMQAMMAPKASLPLASSDSLSQSSLGERMPTARLARSAQATHSTKSAMQTSAVAGGRPTTSSPTNRTTATGARPTSSFAANLALA